MWEASGYGRDETKILAKNHKEQILFFFSCSLLKPMSAIWNSYPGERTQSPHLQVIFMLLTEQTKRITGTKLEFECFGWFIYQMVNAVQCKKLVWEQGINHSAHWSAKGFGCYSRKINELAIHCRAALKQKILHYNKRVFIQKTKRWTSCFVRHLINVI